MDTATIFYNDKKYLAHKSDCFDSRFDSQVIPSGCVAFGFFSVKRNGEIASTIDLPYCATEEMQKSLDEEIALIKRELSWCGKEN